MLSKSTAALCPWDACPTAVRMAVQAIVLQNVEAGAAARGWRHDQGAWSRIVLKLERPVLGILQQSRFHIAKRVGEIATKAPAGILVHRQERADFIVAKAIDVEFLNVVLSAINDELANVVVPQRERKTASESHVREVEALVVIAGIGSTIPKIKTLIIAKESARVVINNVEGHRDAVKVTQVNHSL